MFFRISSFFKNYAQPHARPTTSAAASIPRPRRAPVSPAADGADSSSARGSFLKAKGKGQKDETDFPHSIFLSSPLLFCFYFFAFCLLPFAFCLLPFALFAADGGAADAGTVTHRIQFEFIIPAVIVSALAAWLTSKANAEKKAQRQPPLGEDVARTYATKQELEQCRARCKGDVADVREDIRRLDKKLDESLVRVHSRIDDLGKNLASLNKTTGAILGFLKAKHKGAGPSELDA